MDPAEKKRLKDNYKSSAAVGGIYRLVCEGNGHAIVKSTLDIAGIKSRFNFAMKIKSCPDPNMQKDCLEFGSDSFKLEVLEELTMKEGQTAKEFSDDMEVLYELWLERLSK